MLSPDLLDRASRWEALKRWERRELGQDLRRLGMSYREIARVIPVSKGTLSGWCRDIELGAEQRARLAALRPAAETRIELGRRRRRAAASRQEAIREAARAEAAVHLEDPMWTAGVVAYWSEGSKGRLAQEGTGHRKNVLYAGTANVRVTQSTDLLHRVLGWIDAVRETFGSPYTVIAGR